MLSTPVPVLEPLAVAFTSSMVSWPTQLPETQNGVAPLQARPQTPQFVVVVRLDSQPLSGLPSQLPQLESQVGAQS